MSGAIVRKREGMVKDEMRGEALVQSIAPSDFLTLWDSLANAGSCSELKAAWDQIRDRVEAIAPRGLNELWDFYLERLDKCERRDGR